MSPACFCPHQTGRRMSDWQDRRMDVASSYGVDRSRWSLSSGHLVHTSWDGGWAGDRSNANGDAR